MCAVVGFVIVALVLTCFATDGCWDRVATDLKALGNELTQPVAGLENTDGQPPQNPDPIPPLPEQGELDGSCFIGGQRRTDGTVSRSVWLDPCDASAMADLARRRVERGLPRVGANEDGYTLARLDMDGCGPFYGQNGRTPRSVGYPGAGNGIARTSWEDHAEGAVFSQAYASGCSGGNAVLYLDRKPCPWCANSYAGYARLLDLESLAIFFPGGPYGTYTRGGKFERVG